MAQLWSFVNQGAVSTQANPQPALPTNHAAGDLLIVYATSPQSYGTPAGMSAWTPVYQNTSAAPFLTIWSKVDNGSESAPTVTNSNANSAAAMLCYRGVDQATPVVGTVQTASAATSIASGTVATTNLDELVLQFYGGGVTASSTSTFTADANTTERAKRTCTTAICGLMASQEDKATIGTTTTRTATLNRAVNLQAVEVAWRQTIPLTGQATAGSVAGQPVANSAPALGGQGFVSTAATLHFPPQLTPLEEIPLAGQAQASVAGTLTPSSTGAGDVEAALTGIAGPITATGALGVASEKALAGQVAAGSTGNIAGAGQLLTGAAAAFAAGAISGGQSITGVVLASAAGAITAEAGRSLIGSAAASAAGTAGADLATPLAGAQAAATTGTQTAALSVAITGISAESFTGVVGSSQQGEAGLSAALAEFGAGAVAAEIEVALAGLAAQALAGDLAVAAGADVEVALEGLLAAFSAGSLGTEGGDVIVPPAPPELAEQPAGRAARRRSIRYVVRIDGREFEFGSLAAALALLAQAKAMAAEHARALARAATEVRGVTPKPAAEIRASLKPPRIEGFGPGLGGAVIEAQAAIKATYEGALRDAEIAMHFEVMRRRDEDEDVVMMLLW